jgi:ribosome maturation factor RimP
LAAEERVRTLDTQRTSTRRPVLLGGPAVVVTGDSSEEVRVGQGKDDELAGAVRDLAAPLAAEHDVEVLDVSVRAGQGRKLVKLTADTVADEPGAGLDIDTIAVLSRELGSALDEDDTIPGAYDLEITSPGADRPLTRRREFARNVGRDVRLVLRGDDAEERRGRLVAATDTTLTLEHRGAREDVPLEDVDHGTVVLPW